MPKPRPKTGEEREVRRLLKIDLLPHVRFDMERCIGAAREVNPRIEILRVSAESGEGMRDWYRWLMARRAGAVASN